MFKYAELLSDLTILRRLHYKNNNTPLLYCSEVCYADNTILYELFPTGYLFFYSNLSEPRAFIRYSVSNIFSLLRPLSLQCGNKRKYLSIQYHLQYLRNSELARLTDSFYAYVKWGSFENVSIIIIFTFLLYIGLI